jgi:hypothetical protein
MAAHHMFMSWDFKMRSGVGEDSARALDHCGELGEKSTWGIGGVQPSTCLLFSSRLSFFDQAKRKQDLLGDRNFFFGLMQGPASGN